MKKIVLTFGLIGGVVISALMLTTVAFAKQVGYDRSVIVGYTVIVLSFLVVFFGIRSYRDQNPEAPLTFGRAFQVGLLITLVSCACYVATWELVYFKLKPGFTDKYAEYALEQVRKSGASPEKIAATERQIREFKVQYDSSG